MFRDFKSEMEMKRGHGEAVWNDVREFRRAFHVV